MGAGDSSAGGANPAGRGFGLVGLAQQRLRLLGPSRPIHTSGRRGYVTGVAEVADCGAAEGVGLGAGVVASRILELYWLRAPSVSLPRWR